MNSVKEKINPATKQRVSSFFRRNQVLLFHVPALLGILVATYAVLRAWDARIGIEGFGDLFGYALNGVRAALILFTAWWMKHWLFYDMSRKLESEMFDVAVDGNWSALWRTVLDRAEWVISLAFATWWYTR